MVKRVLICGSRNFSNKTVIENIMKGFLSDTVIIQGGARGADALAKEIAKALHLTCVEYPADWAKHGKAAGAIRNAQMLKEGKPNIVYAFYEVYGNSPGTRDMVTKAEKAKICVYEYSSEGPISVSNSGSVL